MHKQKINGSNFITAVVNIEKDKVHPMENVIPLLISGSMSKILTHTFSSDDSSDTKILISDKDSKILEYFKKYMDNDTIGSEFELSVYNGIIDVYICDPKCYTEINNNIRIDGYNKIDSAIMAQKIIEIVKDKYEVFGSINEITIKMTNSKNKKGIKKE